MADYLVAKGIRGVLADKLKMHLVSGKAFLQMKEDDLKELAPLIGERALLRQIQEENKAAVS